MQKTSCHHDQGHAHHSHGHPESPLDPVCGMEVKTDSPYQENFEGRAYRFCSTKCQEKFQAAPHQYMSHQSHAVHHQHAAPPESSTQARLGAEYTCPMHPEIRQPSPGNCPICGMTLEPVIPELEEEENPELKDFSRRFWWTLPLTVIVTVLAMAGHSLQLFHGTSQNWVELVLATPVTLWGGWVFFTRGIDSIRQRSPNMWTLIGLGTAAAYLYSVAATLVPQWFPGGLRSGWTHRRLLRGRRGDHLAHAVGPDARTQSPLADLCRH